MGAKVTGADFAAVWDRACAVGAPASEVLPGDQALHVVVVFHGRVMNNGLLDAVEGHEQDEAYPLPRVLAAYIFLGMPEVADAIARAHREILELSSTEGGLEDLEARIDDSYPYDVDEALEVAVRRTLERSPDAFAPVS